MPDDKQTLSLATLHKLDDGMVGRVVDAELQKVLRDCEDRPSLDKVRKVTIQLRDHAAARRPLVQPPGY